MVKEIFSTSEESSPMQGFLSNLFSSLLIIIIGITLCMLRRLDTPRIWYFELPLLRSAGNSVVGLR